MSSSSGTTSGTTPPGPSDETLTRRRGGGRTGVYVAVAVVVVVILIVAGGYAAGWFKTSSGGGGGSSGCTLPSSTTITGAGSTLVAPLMLAWSLKYSASTVDYASVGSGAGINDITGKTVQYGASDAPLNPAQRAAIPSPGVVTIPESAGAAVPIYNLPTVGTTLKFTGQVLAAIYLGDITNWNNSALQTINPGVILPNAAIEVVHRSDGSGTTFVWSSYLSSHNATWKSTVGFGTTVNWPVGVGAKGNPGVTDTVKTTTDAIGYVDINYALTNSVSFGAVQNPAGNYIVANVSNIASAISDSNVVLPSPTGDWYNVSVINAPGAGDYPIATFTYVFVYTDLQSAYGSSFTQTQAQNLIDWLAWMVNASKGQTFAAPYYYVPLAPAVIAHDDATISGITYGGAKLTACVPNISYS
jgi:phosphate transport system substrate-binding protein